MNDGGVFSPIIDGAITIGLGIGGWFVRSHNKRLEKIEDHANNVADDLASYKLDSEKRFAKEETTQFSLGRIHDRMDDIADDIKEILSKL